MAYELNASSCNPLTLNISDLHFYSSPSCQIYLGKCHTKCCILKAATATYLNLVWFIPTFSRKGSVSLYLRAHSFHPLYPSPSTKRRVDIKARTFSTKLYTLLQKKIQSGNTIQQGNQRKKTLLNPSAQKG